MYLLDLCYAPECCLVTPYLCINHRDSNSRLGGVVIISKTNDHDNETTKGGFNSENVEGFSNLPKNIPKNYLKFAHPLHDIDKTSILNFFDFTSLFVCRLYKNVF